MKSLKFRAKIGKMGKRYVVNIPKALELEISDFLGKEITVTLEG